MRARIDPVNPDFACPHGRPWAYRPQPTCETGIDDLLSRLSSIPGTTDAARTLHALVAQCLDTLARPALADSCRQRQQAKIRKYFEDYDNNMLLEGETK